MIPIFNGKTARRGGRPAEGPEGCVRRKLHLFHQCYSKLLEGWNTITKNVKILQWADGVRMGVLPVCDARIAQQLLDGIVQAAKEEDKALVSVEGLSKVYPLDPFWDVRIDGFLGQSMRSSLRLTLPSVAAKSPQCEYWHASCCLAR